MIRFRIFFATILLFNAAFISCEETLLEEDLSEAQISILAPNDGSVLTSENVQFNWDSVEQATSYRMQIATPNFNAATQILVDTTVSSLQFTARVLSGEYQWRVRAQNSGSQTPYNTASFSVSE